MSLTLYEATVPSFLRHLNALSLLIEKAEAYAAEKKFPEEALLRARLFPDMYDFAGQVRAATDQAGGGAARVANVPVPAFPDTEASCAELRARIARTIAFLETIKPGQLEGRENVEVTFPMGAAKGSMKGQDYLIGFVVPHFYFHCTTAYGLLRHNGLAVGKRDFFGPAR